jgi:hypothetical protein
MSITIPVPTTLEEALWFGIGLVFGRSFGKKTDYNIKQSEWFKNLKDWQKEVVSKSLDFLHHWWMGLYLVVYGVTAPQALISIFPMLSRVATYWFGWGLFVDDLPDLPDRIRDLFNHTPAAP